MSTFPTLSSGSMKVYGSLADEALAMYPAKLSHAFATRVVRFVDDTEQRWTVRRELFSLILSFSGVNGYDLSIIRDFFKSQKGMYVSTSLSSTFDITIDGQTYSYCAFDQDELTVEVDRAETFSFELKIRQVRPN